MSWSNLNTRDPEGARAFYGAVFGWEADSEQFGGEGSAMWRLPRGTRTFGGLPELNVKRPQITRTLGA